MKRKNRKQRKLEFIRFKNNFRLMKSEAKILVRMSDRLLEYGKVEGYINYAVETLRKSLKEKDLTKYNISSKVETGRVEDDFCHSRTSAIFTFKNNPKNNAIILNI